MTDFGGKTGRKDKGLYERGGLAHPVLRFLVKKRQQEVKGMELGKGWHRSADGKSRWEAFAAVRPLQIFPALAFIWEGMYDSKTRRPCVRVCLSVCRLDTRK